MKKELLQNTNTSDKCGNLKKEYVQMTLRLYQTKVDFEYPYPIADLKPLKKKKQ